MSTDDKKVRIYYDNKCPVCLRFITSVNGSSQKENFACRPMQNLREEDLLSQEFHIIMHDGKVYRKFDAILKIIEMYPQWHFLTAVARLPVIYQILSFGYDIFAAHRYSISKLLNRFSMLKIVLILVTFCTFLLSSKLWLSARLYPQIPLFPFLPIIAFPFDYVIFGTLLILLLIGLVKQNSRKYFIALLSLVVFYALFDQSRFQPEFYQFFLMFLALSFYPWSNNNHKRIMIDTCCFIIASVYIFSGLQKANITFITVVYPWFVGPMLKFFPKELALMILYSGIIVPIIETGIGIGLLTRRFRMLAIIFSIGMHLLILYSLGPFGHNYNNVVWPWNVAMCFFVFILFWGNNTFSLGSFLAHKKPLSLVIVVLCGILPIFSFFNLWDSYLSQSLYSGNIESAQLYIRATDFKYLNPDLRTYITRKNKRYNIIDISMWSYKEMNVPAYPETRIFKGVAKYICHLASNPSGILLQIEEKPKWNTKTSALLKYSCIDL